MTLSYSNRSTRGYIGDWQAANFGGPSPFPLNTRSASSSLSTPAEPARFPDETFGSWTGSLAHLYSRDGSVHISYIGEDTSGIFSRAMRSIKGGIMGTRSQEKQRSHEWAEAAVYHASKDEDMQGYQRPPTEVMELLRERYPKDPRVGYFADDFEQREYTPRSSEGEMIVGDLRDGSGNYWLDGQAAGSSQEPQYGFQSSSPEFSGIHKAPH